MDIVNNIAINKIADALNSGNAVQQTITIKMLKESINQQESLISTLVNGEPKNVEPKYDTSSFEVIV